MRLTLDTVGTIAWPTDQLGRPIFPDGFKELADKLQRPDHPPGRDVRCIVSVGMLTEVWDCNTVTHIIGLRPFMSQSLCEQVVGRGLRRITYELGPDGKLTEEEAIRPDISQGEAPEVPRYEASRGPGSTADVDFWTSRDVREVTKCHLNYVVADTKRWEQSAAYYIDKNEAVDAFVKNSGLGFAIPYLHNGQMHDYVPDFIVRLKTEPASHLILETKGYDPLEEVKRAAAEQWIAAVNADGTYGRWVYMVVKKISDIPACIERAMVH